MKLLNQKGSSILLVMSIASLVGAAGFYFMSLSSDTEKKITSDARVVSYKNLVDVIKSELFVAGKCTKIFENENITNAFSYDGISIKLDLQLKANPRVLKRPSAGGADVWYLQGGTSIKDIRLVINERVAAPLSFDLPKNNPSPENLVAAKGYILIEPGHQGVGWKNWRNKKKFRIPILVYYKIESPSIRRIHSCFDPFGEAYACTLRGGIYNEDESPRCRPLKTCFETKGGTLSIQTPHPCEPHETPLFFGASANQYSYVCMWCNTNSVNLIPADFCGPGKYFAEPTPPPLNSYGFEPDFSTSVPTVSPVSFQGPGPGCG